MKPSTGTRKIQATKKVAKTATLKKPRKYKNVGGVGSSPINSISVEDNNKLIDISNDIVKLVHIYKDLSDLPDSKYSFTGHLVLSRIKTKTKSIKEVIKKIFVEVEKSKFIYIDTPSYIELFIEYDGLINNLIDRITRMTTNDFIVGTTYTKFFDDLYKLLLKFFHYIKTNIKINGDIPDEKILENANGGYEWFYENKEICDNNIRLFMEIQRELINKQEQDRMDKEVETARRHDAIRGLMACKANNGKSCR